MVIPDCKIHGDNMGPTWVLSAPDGPHVGPMNFAIIGGCFTCSLEFCRGCNSLIVLSVMRDRRRNLWWKIYDGSASPTLQWRHNERNGVSNHQPHDCLLNRLFRRRSKKISKIRVTGFVRGSHRSPVNPLHKGPVTRKMFPFDDVIMDATEYTTYFGMRFPSLNMRYYEYACRKLAKRSKTPTRTIFKDILGLIL